MKLLFTLLLGSFFFGCNGQQRTIKFVNLSGSAIDSLRIAISSADVYSIGYNHIETGDSVIAEIPINKPRSNKHDIMVSFTVYIKGRTPIHQYSYNDLIGYLTYDSRIVLNPNDEIEWKNKYEGSY